MAASARDDIVDFTRKWSRRASLPVSRLLRWIGVDRGKYNNWVKRHQKENQHNACMPRDFWLTDRERKAILDYAQEHPENGYRRLACMMIDADVAAVSPSSVYRVLKEAGCLIPTDRKPSKKGSGFVQPTRPHEHWHMDVMHINIVGTFFYMCSILDGYSRCVVHAEIRPAMTETDVEIIVQRAREAFPDARPRIISDNGPQFVSGAFREFIGRCDFSHVTTSPYYPQSNGKIERWQRSAREEALRPKTPLSLEDARRIIAEFIEYYNTVRLHSAIGYITPKDKLEGREKAIFAARREKRAAARKARKASHAA